MIEITFSPTSEKTFNSRFAIGILDNPKLTYLNVKGQGSSVSLEVCTPKISIGPTLPYNNQSTAIILIKNLSEYDTEIYSLEQDAEYYKEEEQLLKYAEFGITDQLFFPVRQVGDPFWKFVLDSNEKKKKQDELKIQIKEEGDEEKKKKLTEILQTLMNEDMIVQFPKKVEEDVMHHCIITGPPGCGKTLLARYVAEKQKRAIINFNEILEWNIQQNTEAAKKAQDYLQAKQVDLENVKQEYDKLLKKAGKNAAKVQEQLGEINELPFSFLSEEIVQELIQSRLQHPECNAGVVFDNLQSKFLPSEIIAIKTIMQALKKYKLQLLVFSHMKDEDGYEVCKPVEWEKMDNTFQQKDLSSSQINPKQSKQVAKRKVSSRLQSVNQATPLPQSKQSNSNQARQSIDSKQIKSKLAPVSEEFNVLEELQENEIPDLFDLYFPKNFEDASEEEKYVQQAEWIKCLFLNEIEKVPIEKLTIPQPQLSLQLPDEKEKDKKKKDGKQPEEQPKEVEDPYPALRENLYTGGSSRDYTEFPFHYNLKQLEKNGSDFIPLPVYPDPDTMPVPQPIYHQIMNRIIQLRQKKESLQNFKILTPPILYKEDYLFKQHQQDMVENESQQNVKQDGGVEQQQQQQQQQHPKELKDPSKTTQQPLTLSSQTPKQQLVISTTVTPKLSNFQDVALSTKETIQGGGTPAVKEKTLEEIFQFKTEELNSNLNRWIIPKKKTLILVLKYFSTQVGTFESKLNFEAFFSQKSYSIQVKGISDYPAISNLPKSIYWNCKKTRPSTQPECYISKAFVISEGLFDFGPLLVGKNPADRQNTAVKNINSTTFRISNNSKFDCNIEISIMSSVITDKPEYQKDIFFIEPESLQLKCGEEEPQEIRVWALPKDSQKYKDDLILMIKDNPMPVVLPLQCLGQKPVVQIIEGEQLLFERLLLQQTSKKFIKIKNVCAIPVKWKLSGIDTLPMEFTLVNISGDLKPTQVAIIEVSFKALNQKKFQQKIFVEVQDIENLNIKQESIPINIEAESFDITIDLKFQNDNKDHLLDFGAVRVGEFKQQQFTVKNLGLYQIKLNCIMKKKVFRDNFKIEPAEITELEPNQEKIIIVKFTSEAELKLQTSNQTTDIILQILEGNTQFLHQQIPINVSVNSVFSKYSILPIKNINFGPILFNEQKVRTFEIKNEGIFEFNYRVFDYNNEEQRKEIQKATEEYIQSLKEAQAGATQQAGGAGKKDSKKETKAAAPAKKEGKKGAGVQDLNALPVGQFKINPYQGSIAPESSATIELSFQGNGQQLYESHLGIDVQGRDPADSNQGIQYDLVGESTIPGINTDVYESIFEEQIVLNSTNMSQNITSQVSSSFFSIEEKTFYFGTLIPSKISPEGVVEKFKITNSNKTPCNVKFDVRKRSQNATENFAFEVAPKQAKIPPHEFVYVKVAFKPTVMTQYFGVFEALVENGESNPKTYKLLFDLRGEGALPTVKLEKPKEWFEEKTPWLKFPKVRVNKSSVLPLVLKNDGQIPSTVKFDLSQNDQFKFLSQTTYTFSPKTYQQFNIEFTPTTAGKKTWNIQMSTNLNPYEIYQLLVTGEGYQEDIIFEDLPNNLDDEVNLSDCVINNEKRVFFNLKNNGNTQIKFNWNTQGSDDITLTPRYGHMAPNSTKQMTLIFNAGKPCNYKDFLLTCETKQITQEKQFQEWDCTKTKTKYVSKTEYQWIMNKRQEEELKRKEEEAAIAAAQKGGKGAKKEAPKKGGKEGGQQAAIGDKPQIDPSEPLDVAIEEMIVEPKYSEIDKSEKSIILKLNAVADYAKYDVDTREIFFGSTMMYTSRSYQFKIKNTSTITLKYNIKLTSAISGKYDPGFYIVSPKQGIILPNCDESFSVKFSPTEIDETNKRLIVVSIENLDPELQTLIIEVDGFAERPICHFELPPTNLVEKKGNFDKKFDMIEFESLGTKVKNIKRFYVVNPTNQGYEFEWKRMDDFQLPAGANTTYQNFFKCNTIKGVILSGKKYEMVFEYQPDLEGIHESYWVFEIAEEKIQQHFLCYGQVKEPNIFIDVGKVNFGPLLLGGKNTQIVKLKNLEEVPIGFNFLKETVKGEIEDANSLYVNPLSGILQPNSDIPLEIVFAPKVEKSFNYNLLCQIQRKARPVHLNIKGVGYILHHNVFYDNIPSTLNPNATHYVKFGEIYINEKKSKTIQIENNGDFNFDFSIKKNSGLNFINITPETGTVRKQEKLQIEVLFVPISECKFKAKNNRFSLSITSGPTYNFDVIASARQPLVNMNFNSYDFGPCFVLKQPLAYTAILELTNQDKIAMSIESNFEKKPYLDFQLNSGQVLLPLQQQDNNTIKDNKDSKDSNNILKVPIVFTARETINYEETITLDINNLHKIDLKIKGEGIPFKLELLKSEDQYVDFGIQNVYSDQTKIVTIVNLSKKTMNLSFDCENQKEELEKYYITYLPDKEFSIASREKREIEIRFNPETRLHNFRKSLFFKIVENQEKKQLLNISGACHGIELKLMEDTIGFGQVVIGSKLVKRVQLANLGDIAAKFFWETDFCKQFFTISPSNGVIPPHEDLYFEITFHPTAVDNDIKFNKVKCNIQSAESLYINLLGKCIAQPKDQILELKFETIVRSSTTQKVVLKNPSEKNWRIKVGITSVQEQFRDYFRGKEYVDIPAKGQADYEITYNPMSMTKNDIVQEIKQESHEANAFFPLPTGEAISYNLIGKSKPPDPVQTVDVSIQAKKQNVKIFNVKNPLKVPQRFEVSWNFEQKDPTIFLNGAHTIDIASESSKEYKLNIMCLKQTTSKISLYFKNPSTKEFLYFKINLTVQPSDFLDKIELQSIVRETASKIITIENPLSTPVQIKKEHMTVDNEYISINPNNFTIAEKSEFGFEIQYRPLLVSDLQAKFSLKSPDLGDYVYNLRLIGLPSIASKTLIFKTTLGSEFNQSFKFQNYLKKPTVYQCQIQKFGVPINKPSEQQQQQGKDQKKDAKAGASGGQQLDFFVDPNVNAPPSDSFDGNEISLNVRYEPSNLTESKSILIVNSNDGGEYQCQLIGYCSPPTPKGPFICSSGKGAAIDFKNPFFEACEFILRFDNPNFSSSAKSPLKIDAKKVQNISIAYKAQPGTSSNGRLIISTGDLPAWTYYLQGE